MRMERLWVEVRGDSPDAPHYLVLDERTHSCFYQGNDGEIYATLYDCPGMTAEDFFFERLENELVSGVGEAWTELLPPSPSLFRLDVL